MSIQTKPESEVVERRSPCPIACTLDVIGDRWTLVIVRDLFRGVGRYKDFLASPEGISTNILAARLERLVEQGFAERYEEPPSKHKSYRLTKKGESLGPLLSSVAEWGLANIEGTEARLMSKPLADALGS
ncbi:MAG: helix-turn-helix domain-containing protein [Planctomycetota bacterium]